MPLRTPGAPGEPRRRGLGDALLDAVERSTNPIAVLDDQLHFIALNEPALETLGHTRGFLIGRSSLDIVADSERPKAPGRDTAWAIELARGTGTYAANRASSEKKAIMNITVLGAAGGTGMQVVQQALDAGHSVTALVRPPQKMPFTDPDLRVVQGDATDQASVTRALEGADAVISTLDAPGPVIAEATRAILGAANADDGPRVVMMSSFAVQRDRLSRVVKLLTRATTGAKMKDKAAGEEALRASKLPWTIVYATLLTNGPRKGPKVVPESDKVGMSDRISRADAASFLLEAATTGGYDRRSVLITGA